jgi:hypothetical protein
MTAPEAVSSDANRYAPAGSAAAEAGGGGDGADAAEEGGDDEPGERTPG